MSVYIKTAMKEMPKNCKDCWVICSLPYENNNGIEHIKQEYCNQRHEDCTLVEIKEERQ